MIDKRQFLKIGIYLLFFLSLPPGKSFAQWRYVKVLRADGSWKRAEFNDLRKGDWFRIFDPNGKPTRWDFYQKEYIYLADCDSFSINEGPPGNSAVRISEAKEF